MKKRGYLWGDPKQYHHYQAAFHKAGATLIFGPSSEPCDFLLLPGGGDIEPWRYGQENTDSRGLEPERDLMELELIDRFLTQGKPVFGVCRGMQVLNVYFNGTLIQDIPEHGTVNGADRYHKVRTVASPIRAICGEEAIVNSAHHQAVDRVGAGLEAVQWSADGVIEAVCHRRLPVWGVQWHPERLGTVVGQRMIQGIIQLAEKI